MAITKTNNVIIAVATSCAAGSSKASPGVVGTVVNCTAVYGGELYYKITNGTSGPGIPVSLTFQQSPDNVNWYDYYTVGGDTAASSQYSNTLALGRGVMYLRAIAYGNTTNAVQVECGLETVTAV